MPNIQIRNVPDHVHLVLKRRADAAGQSLQEYLLGELVHLAGKRTWAEVFADIERRGSAATFESGETAELIRQLRQEREEHMVKVVDEARTGDKRLGR